jgi:AcrR family transcriptional regulator
MSPSAARASAPRPLVRTTLNERKQQFARDAIWDAAIDLFVERGFDQTTVDEIAERAGTSRRSFFRHFESKSDLMSQPVVDWGNSLADAIDAWPSTLTPSELLRKIVLKVVTESASNPRSLRVMEIAAKFPAAREAQYSRVPEVQHKLVQVLARKSKDTVTAHLLAGVIFAVIGTIHHDLLENPGREFKSSIDKAFASLAKAVCDGGRANSARR